MISLSQVAISQWAIAELSDLPWSQEKLLNEIKYIETETDINKIKDLALSLAQSNYSSVELQDFAMHKYQEICLYISFMAAIIVFLTYRVKKRFLTTISTVPINP